MTKEKIKRKRAVLSLTLSDETRAELDRKTKALGIPRTQVVEVVLRDGLGMLENDPIALKIRSS